MEQANQASYTGWARVEVMGHNTHLGHVTTEYFGGVAMLRVDQPEIPEREEQLRAATYSDDGEYLPTGSIVKRPKIEGSTVYVGIGSIYRFIPCTEELCLAAIKASVRSAPKLVSMPDQKALPEAIPLVTVEPWPGMSSDDGEDDDDEDGPF